MRLPLLLHQTLFFLLSLFSGPVFSTEASPPVRVISLSPAVTEILFALHAEEMVVGVSDFSNFPEAAKKIEKVGGYNQPVLEKIISLKPNLVITYEEGVDLITAPLKKAKIELLSLPAKSIQDLEPNIKAIAKKVGREAEGEKLILNIQQQWSKLTPHSSKKKVLIQVDHNPLFIAANHTFLSEVIQKCGHENAAASFDGYLQFSLEKVYDLKPDFILVIGMMSKGNTFESIESYWSKIPYTKSAKVLFVEPDAITRLAPRLPDAARDLCAKLQ